MGLPRRPPGMRMSRCAEGLASRLIRAADALPDGLRLHVVEGYRPSSVQRTYFEAYRQLLLRQWPSPHGR